jgi:hypothetical protein
MKLCLKFETLTSNDLTSIEQRATSNEQRVTIH